MALKLRTDFREASFGLFWYCFVSSILIFNVFLEYRGYDSAGVAVRDGEKLAEVVKAKGQLTNLVERTDRGKALLGTCGIGHTRWATQYVIEDTIK